MKLHFDGVDQLAEFAVGIRDSLPVTAATVDRVRFGVPLRAFPGTDNGRYGNFPAADPILTASASPHKGRSTTREPGRGRSCRRPSRARRRRSLREQRIRGASSAARCQYCASVHGASAHGALAPR